MIEYTEDFEKLWNQYPKRNGRRNGKKPAFTYWKKMSSEEKTAARLDIEKRNRHDGWGKYIKDMERYLKQASWDDEWMPKNQPVLHAGPRTKEPEIRVDRWTAFANRIAFRWLRFVRGVDDERVSELVRTRRDVVTEMGPAMDEELEVGTPQAEVKAMFQAALVAQLDKTFGTNMAGRFK